MASGEPSNAAGRKPSREGRSRIMAKRFKERLVDWQVLYDSLAPRITGMPHLAADHQALGNLLTESRDLEKGQEAARSQLRDINQRRKELDQQAGELNSRLSLG